MRKLVVIGFVIAGAAIGWLSSLSETWALKVFMMGFGGLVGAIAGAAGAVEETTTGGTRAIRSS